MSKRWARQMEQLEAAIDTEALAAFQFADGIGEWTFDYIIAGRRFETLPEPFLAEQWLDAYCTLLSAPHDACAWKQLMSLQCELVLRRIEPPRHLVEAARVERAAEEQRRYSEFDPAAFDEAHAELRKLRKRRARPKR